MNTCTCIWIETYEHNVQITFQKTIVTIFGKQCCSNQESPAQFENRIKPQVYVMRITLSPMNEKALFC